MSTEVTGERDSPTPIIRCKTLTAHSQGMRTVIDYGQFGQIVTDEHGGTGAGPSPLQAGLGALCGCEAVTFARTASAVREAVVGERQQGALAVALQGHLDARGPRFDERLGSLEAPGEDDAVWRFDLEVLADRDVATVDLDAERSARARIEQRAARRGGRRLVRDRLT